MQIADFRLMKTSLLTILLIAAVVYFLSERMEQWMHLAASLVIAVCGVVFVLDGAAVALDSASTDAEPSMSNPRRDSPTTPG